MFDGDINDGSGSICSDEGEEDEEKKISTAEDAKKMKCLGKRKIKSMKRG